MSINPFSFVESITFSKKDIWDETTRTGYVPFIVNRQLSRFPELVHYANDMNRFHQLAPELQYRYLLSTAPKRKRFAKWKKQDKDATLALIMKHFMCNLQAAEEIRMVLSTVQLQELDELYNEQPGPGKNKASRRLPRSKRNA